MMAPIQARYVESSVLVGCSVSLIAVQKAVYKKKCTIYIVLQHYQSYSCIEFSHS